MNFNEKVYAIVRAIPVGKTMSYGQIALLIGNRRRAREVGWALAHLAKRRDASFTDVPWWRVVNRLGMVSIPPEGGAHLDQRDHLIEEGIHFAESAQDTDPPRIADFAATLWIPDPMEILAMIGGWHGDDDLN